MFSLHLYINTALRRMINFIRYTERQYLMKFFYFIVFLYSCTPHIYELWQIISLTKPHIHISWHFKKYILGCFTYTEICRKRSFKILTRYKMVRKSTNFIKYKIIRGNIFDIIIYIIHSLVFRIEINIIKKRIWCYLKR